MKQLLKNAKIVLPDGVEDGYLLIDDGLIASVTHEMPAENIDRIIDLEGRYVSPGFVEIHTHGAGGADFMDGTVDAYLTACRTHLQHGTTTIYPTLLAASNEELQQSMDCFRKAKPLLESMGVTAPGLHLEGPYLNREQKGAINDLYIRDPDAKEYEVLLEQYGDLIARWTIAPELNGALKLGKTLSQNKIVASIGHSNAVYSQMADAVAHGFTHVTHLYSAMSTITRRHGFRYSGVLESSFCLKELSVEIIADGCHLPAELLRMVYELIGPDRVALTCDSMRCAGQNVKSSYLGSLESGVPVLIEDGVAKLTDRSAFAGSVATDDRLVRTMVQEAEVPLHQAIKMMTLTPARIMGITDRKGSIECKKDADLVFLDEHLQITGIMSDGKVLTLSETGGGI